MGGRVVVITMDGPTASGKSTVARLLAQKLGYYYVGSGMLYRGVAYLLVNHFLYTDHTIADATVEHVTFCFDPNRFFYEYKNDGSQSRVFFDGIDITPHLKDSYFDTMASLVSANPTVRTKITHILRDITAECNVVMEGRDIGSVVVPDADFKIFLTASIDVRADRWRDDQAKRGTKFSSSEAVDYITARDERDKNRTIDPMIIPDDAIVVDTSDCTIDETVEKILVYLQRNREI